MSRFRFAVPVVCGLVAALAVPEAAAQTTVITKKATVTFSGKLDLTWAYRDHNYFEAQKGNAGQGAGAYASIPFIDQGLTNAERVAGVSPNPATRQGSEFYLDPNLVLNFSIDVGDQVHGVVELRTPFVNPDAGGKNTTPGTNGGFFQNFKDRSLEVKKLYVEVDELFSPAKEKDEGLLLRAGIMDFKKDLRGDGNAFVIDTAAAAHPFLTTTGAPMAYTAGFADSTEAAGGYAQYKVSIIDVDGWFFNLDESYNGIGQGLAQRRNLPFWGFSTDIFFDANKRYGKAFLTVFDLMNESNTHLVTEGGGLDIYVLRTDEVNLIELFGELYFQQGAYSRHLAPQGKIDQKGAFALDVGAKGKLPPMGEKRFIPYAEFSYVEVSGDSNAGDRENSSFVSLEGNSRTLVVENNYYGYNVNTNYRGPRIAAGFNVGKFNFEILYAYFELQSNKHGRSAGGGGAGGNRHDKIGDEIDFTVGYEYSANLKVEFGSGWLMDSQALGQSATTQVSLFKVVLEF